MAGEEGICDGGAHMLILIRCLCSTSGLVTFEDILEEVVGEIYDEDDKEEQEEDRSLIRREGDSFLIKGSANLEDVCEVLSVRLEEHEGGENSMTMGGLLCAVLGEIPRAGQQVELQGFLFTAEEVDERRVLSVRAAPLRSEKEETENREAVGGDVGYVPPTYEASRGALHRGDDSVVYLTHR